SKLVEWHENGVCAVVGATNIAELEKVAGYFKKTGKMVPLLIPGVGSQGGSATEVMAVLKKAYGKDSGIHRVNSSSGITYAYLKNGNSDHVGSALGEIQRLNSALKL
ncbi:MAG TPA: hypothetical protein PLO51_01165, partial [Candidatus Micrarchaeota archaeon]|nr:hypothetical protein [Candidatus Micrarchaeota archaeon]